MSSVGVKPRMNKLMPLLVALLAVSCGGTGVNTRGPIDRPSGSDEVVLKVELVGGFVPAHTHLTAVPSVVLLGDGTMVTQGPQIEIYPGPALPNLLARSLTPDAVDRVLSEASEAGLMKGDRKLSQPTVMDAPTTVFTVHADGKTHRTMIDALGIGAGPDGDESGERAKILSFFQKIGDPQSWLPEGSVGEEKPFQPERLQIVFQPRELDTRQTPEGMDQPTKPWPLDEPASALGEEFDTFSGLTGSRCTTLDADQADRMYSALADANQLTPWVSEGVEWVVYPKPLFPDEEGCDHPLRDPVQSPEG